MGNRQHIVNTNRYKVFLKALEENNIPAKETLVYTDMINNIMLDRTLDTIMNSKIDCIICSDDIICSRVLTRLNENKYSVPKDVKVASFYDSAYLENYNPPITSLRIDIKTLGIEAGKCLINLIEGKEIVNKTLLDYEIVLKKSTM